jgi:hypothetical protein
MVTATLQSAERLAYSPLRVRLPVTLRLRTVRPSLLDKRFCGDAWIVQGEEDCTLCLGDYSLARIQGSPLDLPVLNNLLDRVRHRRPRRKLQYN